jgi:hypothetical protein
MIVIIRIRDDKMIEIHKHDHHYHIFILNWFFISIGYGKCDKTGFIYKS